MLRKQHAEGLARHRHEKSAHRGGQLRMRFSQVETLYLEGRGTY